MDTLGLIAFAKALRSTTIHDLVETASAIGSVGLIVAALFALFTRFGGPAAATATLVTGAVVWLAAIKLEFTSVPYVLAVDMAAVALSASEYCCADQRDILALWVGAPWPFVLFRNWRLWQKDGARQHQLTMFSAH